VQREARLYLVMMAAFTLAMALSNSFLSVFIWKLNSSFALLAVYSLVYSLVVLTSFPLCAMFARRRSPMASLRVGIVWFLLTFGAVLWLQERSVDFIWLIGFGMGMGASFFAIGMHMQALDSTEDRGRDRFLYVGNFLNSVAGMFAPLLAGYLISRGDGMSGYYLVFVLTFAWFMVAALISLRLRGNAVSERSHFRDVWTRPTREWRGMYRVTIGAGFVEGTYSTFLVTLMGYAVLQNELSLGGFATFAGGISLLTSLVLSRVSRPENRLLIYSVGAVLLAVSSIGVSVVQTFWMLVVYTVVSTVGMNMINTTFNAWTYASIEKDPEFAARRLDYIVVREIPLGVGRMAGVLLFLTLQWLIEVESILGVSFSLFGSAFVLMIPLLRRIWHEAPSRAQKSTVL
jgi:YQGE family putative transporter